MTNQAERTQRALGLVFSILGAVLLGLGLLQLVVWWNGQLSGLTIEPIVVPLGLIFLLVGLPRLLEARRVGWLRRHGVTASAEVLAVASTRIVIDKRFPVLQLSLRVEPQGSEPFTTELRWPMGMQMLVPGNRVEVRCRPGRRRWVIPV